MPPPGADQFVTTTRRACLGSAARSRRARLMPVRCQCGRRSARSGFFEPERSARCLKTVADAGETFTLEVYPRKCKEQEVAESGSRPALYE